jgi:hypothetical protein
MRTYTCRFCGGQIIFRTLKATETIQNPPRTAVKGRVVPIHIDGGCQMRLSL